MTDADHRPAEEATRPARAHSGAYPEVLNFDEAADFLGVSTKTFAKVLRSENLPGRKVGREWKFTRQSLLDWIASGQTRDFMDEDEAPEGAESHAARAPRDAKKAPAAPAPDRPKIAGSIEAEED